jgi:glycosidase
MTSPHAATESRSTYVTSPRLHRSLLLSATLATLVLLGGCQAPPAEPAAVSDEAGAAAGYYGTLEPFVSEAVYFVVTDRFVNGDPANDHRDQGHPFPSFDQPVPDAPPGGSANVGYLGGDFRGLADNADYIREMGFSAVWITPIVDNPAQHFSGGDPVAWGGHFTDRGKSGYHGYWGVNFYTVDEHLPSEGFGFPELTAHLRDRGLKTVLDIVANHGSPSFTMPEDQPEYGEIYGPGGELLADHQNLHPTDLDPDNNPLHRFFRAEPDLAQLSNLDDRNPEVLEYFVGAYLQWIAQGAEAFRIDTIRHVPHEFWKQFADRIRAEHPGFFMFGEAFDHEAANIAPHTWLENGGISVLDFPLKERMVALFEDPDSDYATIEERLYLVDGPYQNPYDLATFYDNHDMARLNASDEGFIDAHNLLFTVRGFPVIYYGSEIAFERGRGEHQGNRNYFGQANVDAARNHPIRERLSRIAKVRQDSVALQRGLQVNLEFTGHRAAFLRVFDHDGTRQTALVLLNKGPAPETFVLDGLPAGDWTDAFDAAQGALPVRGTLRVEVPAHDVQVYLFDGAVADDAALSAKLQVLMEGRQRRTSDAPPAAPVAAH